MDKCGLLSHSNAHIVLPVLVGLKSYTPLLMYLCIQTIYIYIYIYIDNICCYKHKHYNIIVICHFGLFG